MSVDSIPKIGKIGGLEEIAGRGNSGAPGVGEAFQQTLKDALSSVDRLQKESEVAQQAYAGGEDVELHDVLIKIEEAEVAFKAMMEVRNKLVDAYREVMRIGSGG